MNKYLILTIFIFGSIISHAQSKKITGAWLWRDSKTSISLFINEDSTIEKHIGPTNEPIIDKNLIRGSYKLIDNHNLIITWNDKSVETYTIKLMNNFTSQIQWVDKETNALKTYIFKKVIDVEEVIDN